MVVLLFAFFAVLALAGAVVVITARDPFISAIALIVHFAALGGVYLTLESPFVALAQVIVYAGAVVVLFLFVLAYLGDTRELPRDSTTTRGRWIAPVGGVFTAALVATFLWAAFHPDTKSLFAGADITEAFGSAAAIGEAFMTTYLLEFEATSLVLLVAVVGGLVLGLTGRTRHNRLREMMQTKSSEEYKRDLTVKDREGSE